MSDQYTEEEQKKKRVEVLYRGFGLPTPLTRTPAVFRLIVKMRSVFSFGFEHKDIYSNALLGRLWRWSLPPLFFIFVITLEIGLFVACAWFKYEVFTGKATGFGNQFIMIPRGIAWGLLSGTLGFLAIPWSIARWRGRDVLTDVYLTSLKPREIFAAIWLPSLHLIIFPAILLSLLDLIVVPAAYLYIHRQPMPGWYLAELATIIGLPFQFGMIYMGLMIAWVSTIIPSLKNKSMGMALLKSAGRVLYHMLIAGIYFFFHYGFILFIVLMCSGRPALAILVYGAWWAFRICDDLGDDAQAALREVDKHWWEWVSDEAGDDRIG